MVAVCVNLRDIIRPFIVSDYVNNKYNQHSSDNFIIHSLAFLDKRVIWEVVATVLYLKNEARTRLK